MILPLVLTTLMGIVPNGGEKVTINEFSYDDSGTDTVEFVEIHNPSIAPVDISGWVLDSNDPSGPNTAFTVPANTILAGGGYYVFGSALVPNVDQVVGISNIWENSQESLILKDADGNIIDSLIYEGNKGSWPAAKPEGEGIWANMTLIEGRETSWQRVRDSHDTNNNQDFRLAPWTPGASNNIAPGIYIENFDALTPNDVVADFGGSFADVFVIDPTVVDLNGNNPNAIAASPQGGNAAIAWDKSGGGNSNMLLRDATSNVIIEGYFYFDAVAEATGEHETWSIGHGTTGTFYNTPDPGGSLGFTANGNVGVSWTYQVTDAGATLYLIDHNDGGWGATAKTDAKILGSIAITTGTNDGWQRLRLELDGPNVTGYFGGALNSTNGTKITGTRDNVAPGGVYIGYREFVTNNGGARPCTFDALSIIPAADASEVNTVRGTARATTVGTPRVGTNGAPLIANSSFALTAIDLVPSSLSIWALGIATGPGLDLSTIGGQDCSFLYVTPILELRFATPATGELTVPVAIPNDPTLKGATLDIQVFDVDPALTVAVQVGNSRVLNLKID